MHLGSDPIPRWRADRDYYPKGDARRPAHIAHIDVQERINARIVASAGDGSYAVIVARKDLT